MGVIHKLDPKVVDQIAAGEVVERPASVLKELIENSIDANSRNIIVRLTNGGIDAIEVRDDGDGISFDDIELCLDAHATSKITDISDIDNIDTLGFRGEALSSIASVSELKITSKPKEGEQKTAISIGINFGIKEKVERTTRDIGTTVTVKNIFKNIPARKKFLKSESTEYRKSLDRFVRIALINPHIHFILFNNDKEIYNLPSLKDSQKGSIHPQRLEMLVRNIEWLPVFYDGEGITIGGYVGHPSQFYKRTSEQYLYVNGRSIWDSGIAKSVSLGANRYIPQGTKIPFVLSLTILPHLIDINVHPQKLEVRFANPYRIYSAVEDSVKSSLSGISKSSEPQRDDLFRNKDKFYSDAGDISESRASLFRSGKTYEIEKNIQFSKMILEDVGLPNENYKTTIVPVLGKYIVVEKNEEVWIYDQHAAAERIRYEKLMREYSGKGIESQSMLVPEKLDLKESDHEFVRQYNKTLKWFGFDFNDNYDLLIGVPRLLIDADIRKILMDVIEILKSFEDFDNSEEMVKNEYRDSIIATMACHSSLRANKKISVSEAENIVAELEKCENSYSCPHGRPIVWKISTEELNKHFNRT